MLVKKIEYESFESFFADVLPNGKLGCKFSDYTKFVFRGESSSTYKLIPSALREENICKIDDSKHIRGAGEQIRLEYSLLRNFFTIANDNGLKLPFGNAFRKNYLSFLPTEFAFQNNKYSWLSEESEDIAALAQHYGVYTRLLDWTSDLFTAIYFASQGVLKRWSNNIYDSKDCMVIWALNSGNIHSSPIYSKPLPLRLVVPPYYDNPNLNAQKGVLSYWKIEMVDRKAEDEDIMSGNRKLTVDRRSLDELLGEYDDINDDEFVMLYKLEIPVAECIKMYTTLKSLGYTAAKVFPGYNGVSKQMQEEKIAERFSCWQNMGCKECNSVK